jgi:hypothetical protein
VTLDFEEATMSTDNLFSSDNRSTDEHAIAPSAIIAPGMIHTDQAGKVAELCQAACLPAFLSKKSAWLIAAFTASGWNGFVIRNAGSGFSPVSKRSG